MYTVNATDKPGFTYNADLYCAAHVSADGLRVAQDFYCGRITDTEQAALLIPIGTEFDYQPTCAECGEVLARMSSPAKVVPQVEPDWNCGVFTGR